MRFIKDWKHFKKGDDASKLSKAMMSLARFRGVVSGEAQGDPLPTSKDTKAVIIEHLKMRGYAVDESMTKRELLMLL
jgi:hypothetical protein